jgi:hypothetical protein
VHRDRWCHGATARRCHGVCVCVLVACVWHAIGANMYRDEIDDRDKNGGRDGHRAFAGMPILQSLGSGLRVKRIADPVARCIRAD